MIAYRHPYGSINPTAIVGPGIAATAVSTVAAVVFCKVVEGKRRISCLPLSYYSRIDEKVSQSGKNTKRVRTAGKF